MLGWIARSLLILLGAIIIAATVIPAYPGNEWWIRFLEFPRIEYVIAGAAVWVLLALLARGFVSRLMLFALAGALAYNAFLLYPFTEFAAPNQIAAETCLPENRLRLLAVNLERTNERAERLLSIVRNADPDVAWFQEVDERWLRDLAALSEAMPHVIADAKPNAFGVALFSRYPLLDPEIKMLTRSRDPAVFTGVQLPSGQPVRVYGIHPRPPQIGQSTAERDAQILATALAAHDDNMPHIVAGDLNAVPWGHIVQRLKRIGRLLDPRIGRGFYITWNVNNPVLKWPLDQILPGQAFTLGALRVLPDFGSDHLPYLAELCFDRAAPAWQSPSPMHAGDVQAARDAVARYVNRAD